MKKEIRNLIKKLKKRKIKRLKNKKKSKKILIKFKMFKNQVFFEKFILL